MLATDIRATRNGYILLFFLFLTVNSKVNTISIKRRARNQITLSTRPRFFGLKMNVSH